MTADAEAPDGMRLELHGVLAEILALSGGQKSKQPSFGLGCQLLIYLVAGA